jgi:Trk K+ transport system NAD-binding subunit/nucleotide-binding universal stress UspA family protein
VEAQRHAVIVGAGQIGQKLVEVLPQHWSIVLIDIDEKKLENFSDTANITTLCGDASSRLVLEKADLKASTVVFLSTLNDVLNRECCRITKEFFHVEEIVCIQRKDQGDPLPDDINVIDTSRIMALHMCNQVASTYKGIGIGLGEGELRQITILSSSSAVGKSLKELKPKSWLVAAIYRDQKLIVPHGDTILRAKDRVLLVGDPDTLDSKQQFIRGGKLMFPTQFGPFIGHPRLDHKEQSEINWFQENTLAHSMHEFKEMDFSKDVPKNLANELVQEKIGCLVLPPKPIPWFSRFGFTNPLQNKILLSANVPVFVPRGTFPFQKILLAVGQQEKAGPLAAIAVDLARQFDAKLSTLCVISPHSDNKEAEEIEQIPKEISQIARSNGIETEKMIDKGNPIHKIREHASNFDLLILGYSNFSKNSVFTPDISLHLLHDTPCSILFIPWDVAK